MFPSFIQNPEGDYRVVTQVAEPILSDTSTIFTFMSYNILADYLVDPALHHYDCNSNTDILDWQFRGPRIIEKILQHRPDIIALQEVDKYEDLLAGLRPHGYEGAFRPRTGGKADGLATFWARRRFRARRRHDLALRRPDLHPYLDRDNVALMLELEVLPAGEDGTVRGGGGNKEEEVMVVAPASLPLAPPPPPATAAGAAAGWGGGGGGNPFALLQDDCDENYYKKKKKKRKRGNKEKRIEQQGETDIFGEPKKEDCTKKQQETILVVGNTHLLFNPKRGDVKVAQLQLLLQKLEEISHCDNAAPQGSGAAAAAAGAPAAAGGGLAAPAAAPRRPVLLGGDFNLTPAGACYALLRRGFLRPRGLDRRLVSGQELRQEFWGCLDRWAPPVPGVAHRGAGAAAGAFWQEGEGEEEEEGEPGGPRGRQRRRGGGGGGRGGGKRRGRRHAAGGAREESDGEEQEHKKEGSAPLGFPPLLWDSTDREKFPAPRPIVGVDAPRVISHGLGLESAYGCWPLGDGGTGEPAFTTFHRQFQGTVDYVWYTPPQGEGGGAAGRSAGLHLLELLEPPLRPALMGAAAAAAAAGGRGGGGGGGGGRGGGLPSAVEPSDHLPLLAAFQLTGAAAAAAGRPLLPPQPPPPPPPPAGGWTPPPDYYPQQW